MREGGAHPITLQLKRWHRSETQLIHFYQVRKAKASGIRLPYDASDKSASPEWKLTRKTTITKLLEARLNMPQKLYFDG